METYGNIRTFKTAHFTVRVSAEVDLDADWGAFDFEGGEEARDKVESGEWTLFTACVRVIHDQLGKIGEDYLGGCIYSDIAEFEDHRECAAETRKLRAAGSQAMVGSYFAGMIAEAIKEARQTLRAAKGIYVRGSK
jgi:hypothetical protein